MDNIFTPEEENMPVTYGALAIILQAFAAEIAKNNINDVDDLQDYTFKIIEKLTDSIVQIRDNAEYNRQRDMHFMLGLFDQFRMCNKEDLYKEYKRWCEEFDKLNKPKDILEAPDA